MIVCKKKSWLWLFLPFVSLLVLLAPLLKPGVPYNHDIENHLARFANYKLAIKQGQIPPRLAPNLVNHYGYPVFNYNYPLANILSLPFSAVNIHYQITYKILVAASFILGVVGLMKWLQLLGIESKHSRSLAAAGYLLTPFVVNLIYVRGNIGEIIAINLIIWLGVIIEQAKAGLLKENNIWSKLWPVLLMTSFLLSHNISVMFGLGLIVVYGLLRGLSQKKWLRLGKLFVIAVGLSLWFWLPALAEKQYIVLDNVNLSSAFARHFPTLGQLLISPLSFGFSYASPVDTMSFAVGKPALSALAAALALVFFGKKSKNKKDNLSLIFLVLSVLLFIMQLEATSFLWQIVPLANYIQFPWRLGMFLTITASMLLAVVAEKSDKLKWLLLMVVVLQLVSVAKLRAVDRVDKEQVAYDVFAESTTTLNENTAKTFKYKQIADWEPTAKIVRGQGEIDVNYWFGSRRSYDVMAAERSLIVEPTMNFPGWITKANGEKVDYIDDEQIAGRVAFWLNPGHYVVTTRFTQQTWPRILGNSLFVITAGYCLWQIARAKQQHA